MPFFKNIISEVSHHFCNILLIKILFIRIESPSPQDLCSPTGLHIYIERQEARGIGRLAKRLPTSIVNTIFL